MECLAHRAVMFKKKKRKKERGKKDKPGHPLTSVRMLLNTGNKTIIHLPQQGREIYLCTYSRWRDGSNLFSTAISCFLSILHHYVCVWVCMCVCVSVHSFKPTVFVLNINEHMYWGGLNVLHIISFTDSHVLMYILCLPSVAFGVMLCTACKKPSKSVPHTPWNSNLLLHLPPLLLLLSLH